MRFKSADLSRALVPLKDIKNLPNMPPLPVQPASIAEMVAGMLFSSFIFPTIKYTLFFMLLLMIDVLLRGAGVEMRYVSVEV